MEAVWQKIKADILKRPVISILIVMTIATPSMLLILALATLLNLFSPYDRSFAELNGAHLWLYFDRERTRIRDINRIEDMPEVTESTGLQYSMNTRARMRDTSAWVGLRMAPLSQPDVNRLQIQDGRYLQPRSLEIMAGKDLNYLYELEINDLITITRSDGKKVSLPVVGMVYDPTWDTYRSTQPPYLYVSEETFRYFFPDESTWDWSLGLRLSDPEAVNPFLNRLKSALYSGAINAHTDWRDVRSAAMFGVQLNFVFLGTFSLFAILAAILVISTSINTTVISQFRQIGILKSVGFTQAQILALYLGQYVLLGVAGGLLGMAAGIALSPVPLKSVAASMSATYRPSVEPGLLAVGLILILGVIIVSTIGAALRGARANIVRTITTGAEAPRQKTFWLITLAERLGLPLIFVLSLHDVFAKPFRSFMVGLSLTTGVIGIVFGLTLSDTFKTYREEPEKLGVVHDALVTAETTGRSKMNRLLQRAPGVDAFYYENVIDVETLDGKSFRVRAVEGDLASFPFQVPAGRFFEPGAYEALAGRGLLNWLGLKVGDEITLTVKKHANRQVTWRIVGQYVEPADAGQMLMVSMPTMARLAGELEPGAYYLKLNPRADVPLLTQHLQPRPDADINLTIVQEKIPDFVIYLQLSIIALGGVLIGIALVNVFNTSLLSMQEKVRTIGVLKTLGMTPAQVMGMAITSAGLLGLLGAIVGAPIGLLFTQTALNFMAQSYGMSEVVISPDFFSMLVLIPSVAVVSMLGSFIPVRWAAHMPIVRVFRVE